MKSLIPSTKTLPSSIPKVLIKAKNEILQDSKKTKWDKKWDKAWEKGPWDKGHWANRK